MSEISWSHDFCLFCDRQTTERTYCSQACRLADLEKAGQSIPTSPSSSSSPGSSSWRSQSSPTTAQRSQFCLPPAVDFTAYRSGSSKHYSPPRSPTIPKPSSYFVTGTVNTAPISQSTAGRSLSPSSSRSSLSSSCSGNGSGLSDQVLRELRSYSNSFDQSRDWKRRVTLG